MLLSDPQRPHNNLSAFVQVVDNFPIISHHSILSIPMNRWIRSSFLPGPFLLFPPFTSSYFAKILQMIEVDSKSLPSLLRSNHPEMEGCYFPELPAFHASLNSLQLSHLWVSQDKKGTVWFIGADSQSPSPSPRSGYSEALTIINSNPPTSQTHPYHPFPSHIIALGSHKPNPLPRQTQPTPTGTIIWSQRRNRVNQRMSCSYLYFHRG